jgi:predicted AlkP superfamily pyrophosphatase or phosphodiesterase
MPNMGVIKELVVPAKGLLTRVDVVVITSSYGESATAMRVIIMDKSYPNTEAGFALARVAYANHLWDSNIDGTLDIPTTSVGIKVSRIFENGGLDYENQDSTQVAKLYAFIDVDNTTALLEVQINIKTQERLG